MSHCQLCANDPHAWSGARTAECGHSSKLDGTRVFCGFYSVIGPASRTMGGSRGVGKQSFLLLLNSGQAPGLAGPEARAAQNHGIRQDVMMLQAERRRSPTRFCFSDSDAVG